MSEEVKLPRCLVCGESGYAPSYGGPNICPSCDCGIPPEVSRLRRENEALRAQLREYAAAAIRKG